MEWGDVIRFGVGSDIVPFLLGIMILSTGVVESGLAQRVSRRVVRIAGGDPNGRFWLSILQQSLCSVARKSRGRRNASADSNCYHGLKWPGSRSFQLRHGPFHRMRMGSPDWQHSHTGRRCLEPRCYWFLARPCRRTLGFTQWMAVGVPAALLMILPAWALLILLFRRR